jgi:hypothetical protein
VKAARKLKNSAAAKAEKIEEIKIMRVTPPQPFTIEDELAADEYLTALLEKPEYRSMDEVHQRAAAYIKDERVKKYFIDKAKKYLESLR